MNIEELANNFLSDLFIDLNYYDEDHYSGRSFRDELQELIKKVYDEGEHQGFRKGIVEGMRNAKL